MDARAAQQLADMVAAGYVNQRGQHVYFSTWDSAMHHAWVSDFLAKHGNCAPGTARNYLKEKWLAIKKISIDYKRSFSDEEKAARMDFAESLLGLWYTDLKEVLVHTIWADWGALYVDLRKGTAIVCTKTLQEGRLTISSPQCPRTSRSDVIRLKFCIFVSALCGPLYISMATGTTGFTPNMGRSKVCMCHACMHARYIHMCLLAYARSYIATA